MTSNHLLWRCVLAALACVALLVASTGCGRRARRRGVTASPTTASDAATTPALTPSATSGTPASAPAAPPVPAEYASLVQTVTRGLDAWQAQLGSAPAPAAGNTVFGAELLAANANRGPALLTAATLDSINPMLDRLQQLGVRGVTINVNFPLLNPDYPRSSDYLAFYQAVAQRVRAHRMTLCVEQHVIFSGTAFSGVQFDYSKLPFDEFVAQFHTMTQRVIDHLHPDYLTLLSEPDTFTQLTGYRSASTPAGAAAWIDRVVTGVRRGSTKIGAGAGSWLRDAPLYDEAFAKLPLDYIDLHIYPMSATVAQTLQQIAAVARGANRPLVIDEVWLQKLGPSDAGGVQQADVIFRRDAYSFWQPLDTRFLDLVARYAGASNAAYVSAFWSTYFWAYADYGPTTKDLSYARLSAQVNARAGDAIRAGTFTPTGVAYGKIAAR